MDTPRVSIRWELSIWMDPFDFWDRWIRGRGWVCPVALRRGWLWWSSDDDDDDFGGGGGGGRDGGRDDDGGGTMEWRSMEETLDDGS
eukprot:CAMPEP_0196131518 /NCGR_PEP_ID=MMETSP0910-20130528/1494_1 /TAXON_ID=49265 /ORGANISM="Thalassiosira rotula, Strain GSO102" /LENGTH=86 /DNA_ID=CAMNT_0041390995 /DNA_START=358 /DNA_END=619 /DNA_ORIENTATION=-